MSSHLFPRFAPAIRAFSGDVHSPSLHLQTEGRLTMQYAPFEWVNSTAKLIIVGITPGETQAATALHEARRRMLEGASDLEAQIAAKRTGGFSGEMRENLVAMLDRVGLHHWAGISSCSDLFGTRAHILQTASVLPYPVFVDGRKPYKGTPALLRSPMLRTLMVERFLPVAQALPDAHILAVGDVPWDSLKWLVAAGHLRGDRLLGQLPHPSRASQERVNYFVGLKSASALSPKTNAAKLDTMRSKLEQAIGSLRGL